MCATQQIFKYVKAGLFNCYAYNTISRNLRPNQFFMPICSPNGYTTLFPMKFIWLNHRLEKVFLLLFFCCLLFILFTWSLKFKQVEVKLILGKELLCLYIITHHLQTFYLNNRNTSISAVQNTKIFCIPAYFSFLFHLSGCLTPKQTSNLSLIESVYFIILKSTKNVFIVANGRIPACVPWELNFCPNVLAHLQYTYLCRSGVYPQLCYLKRIFVLENPIEMWHRVSKGVLGQERIGQQYTSTWFIPEKLSSYR